jgi:hypothetical protein
MTTVGVMIACLSLVCFFIAWEGRGKFNFGVSIILSVLALAMVRYGSLGRPAKCADGYYKMDSAVFQNKQMLFMAHDVDEPHQVKLCRVPLKNVHTLRCSDIYIWLVDEKDGQHLYLSPPSVERETE